MFPKSLKNYLPLLLIVLISIFFRFAFLDKIPTAIGGDEIVYILNAKASFITGHDIFAKWSPLQGLIFQYPKGETQAELPYILNSIVVGPLPFSILSAHLANGILGIILVIFIYLLTKELLGKNPALFAAFIASINPWLVVMGRTAYEAIPATLFYFISIYILIKAKGNRIFLALPFLALAFYSYIATKIIFLPLVFLVVLYSYFVVNKRKFKKQYLILILFCILFVGFYVVSLKLNPQTARLGEILTPNSQGISEEVNNIRKNSITNPLTNLFVNKYSIYVNILFTKFLKTFATDYLFVSGDEFFSIWRHGLFYYIDSLFLILGSLFMFIKKRKLFFSILLLIIAGTLPQVFHTAETSNFSIHATLTYPFLIILIGYGIFETINYFKNNKIQTASLFIILVLYVISAANFFNIYTSWYPIQGYSDFPIRIVSSYSQRAASLQKIVVYSNSSFDTFKKFIFYANWYNKNTAQKISQNLNAKNYSFGNVAFKSCNIPNIKNTNEVSIIDSKCTGAFIGKSNLIIPQLKDGGATFVIYNDKICADAKLNGYLSNFKLADFDIEKLSDIDFCEKFIVSQ